MSDLIRREDAIKALYKYNFVTKEVIEREIMSIPSAERKGEWIVRNNTDFYGGEECACSMCDYGYSTKGFCEPWSFKYCPHCGAKMFAKDTNVPNKKGADDE